MNPTMCHHPTALARRFVSRLRGAVAVVLIASAALSPAQPLVVGDFSSAEPGAAIPAEWVPQTFRNIDRHTSYALVADALHGTVIHAQARASASGLIRRLDVETGVRPVLRWRWKVARPVNGGDVTRRDGDDYAARVYVSFRYTPELLSFSERAKFAAARVFYGEYPPHAALNYIWDAKAPVGTIVPNPYTDRVRMIVVETGVARAGRWLDYERDVITDYRAAFGSEPPPIAGIAIMTDTDNTGDTVEAWYGDITLWPRR